MMRALLLLLLAANTVLAQLGPNGATASFRGSLPPKPVAALSPEQEAALQADLAEVAGSFAAVAKHPHAADADIFLKAVRYALEFDEWYDKTPEDGVKKATALLTEAKSRIAALQRNETPWMNGSGWKVLGYYSRIDDSPQPYGVEIPQGLIVPGGKPVPMWIWLHGRGDTTTDLPFIYGKLTAKKPGQFQPAGTIVIHPFGRYCNGWKSAGETDVFESRDDAIERFNVDKDRIALAGFSMGGAGAWHMGAHYADQWACVHTGAGFVDVKRYLKLTPDKYPSSYEQKLWGVYDVPDVARNFLNVPLICYSGELDAQRDSAEYMMEILGREGLRPPHLIGAGMGHKYHPETSKEVQRLIEEAVAKGRDPWPKKVSLQTRSFFSPKLFWVRVLKFAQEWEDTRIDAEIIDAEKTIRVTTKNVTALHLARNETTKGYKVVIDGAEAAGTGEIGYQAGTPSWRSLERAVSGKSAGSHGPVDAAFLDRFVIVLPDRKGVSPAVDQWVATESAHFITRWRSLMRGDPLVVKASDLTDAMRGTRILWGDPDSNSQIAAIADQLKVEWVGDKLSIGSQSFDRSHHVPSMIQGLADGTTVVLNSGLTFREAHDRTNSLRNPKLPDWAILNISVPPSAESAGKVVAADFFDGHWEAVLPD